MIKNSIWLVSFGDILTLLLCFAIVSLSGNYKNLGQNQGIIVFQQSPNRGTQIANLNVKQSIIYRQDGFEDPKRLIRAARRTKALRVEMNLPLKQEAVAFVSQIKAGSKGLKVSYRFSKREKVRIAFRVET